MGDCMLLVLIDVAAPEYFGASSGDEDVILADVSAAKVIACCDSVAPCCC